MQEEKVKKKKKFKWWYILIAILVIGIIGAMFGEDDGVKPADQKKTEPQEQTSGVTEPPTTEAKSLFGVGEGADLNGVVATLVSVETSSGSQFNKPADGNVFVFCEFEIENNSDSEIAVSSVMSFSAYADDYAINQSLAGIMETDKGQLDGTVAAGKKMKGTISYEVPKDWKEIEIRFTPNFWKGSEIVFVAAQ